MMDTYDKATSITPNNNTVSHELQEARYRSSAEQVANVVNACLKSENYYDMNRQLSQIHVGDTIKGDYIFEHPGIFKTCVAILLCVISLLAFLYFILIGSLTVYFSDAYFYVGMMFMGVAGIFFLANIAIIVKCIETVKYKVRYEIYSEIIGFKSLEFVEDICACSRRKKRVVLKDLKKAIQQKLIPQGHFSEGNLVFMVSDQVYDRYLEKPAVYDRYFQQKIEERCREKSRTKYIIDIMERGEAYIKQLNGYKALINDKAVSKQIEHLSNVAFMIFHEIDVEPIRANTLGIFLDCYIPASEKLLDTYVSIIEKKVMVSNLATAKKEIETALDKMIKAFEGILEQIYEELEMDISSEIDAIELVMKKNGLSV